MIIDLITAKIKEYEKKRPVYPNTLVIHHDDLLMLIVQERINVTFPLPDVFYINGMLVNSTFDRERGDIEVFFDKYQERNLKPKNESNV